MINAGSSRSRGVRDGGGVGANMQAHKRLVYNPCLPSASLGRERTRCCGSQRSRQLHRGMKYIKSDLVVVRRTGRAFRLA